MTSHQVQAWPTSPSAHLAMGLMQPCCSCTVAVHLATISMQDIVSYCEVCCLKPCCSGTCECVCILNLRQSVRVITIVSTLHALSCRTKAAYQLAQTSCCGLKCLAHMLGYYINTLCTCCRQKHIHQEHLCLLHSGPQPEGE